ncbi:penicillin-binding protein 2 [Pectinatus brassicae]|uniref:Penicillin-binding protein 2 n=1 Tax=Pectinatus brassicae TaxID=862415 RepID=A0A840UMJ5_9FIRM|nr:penicillin-binding protein 2 [Pectinatus brassicae]MBB5337037.1 penicillin-binding protein 2 [Pectinatus brassicae]
MDSKDVSGRLKALSIVSVLIIFVLIARVGYLQIYQGDFYKRQAEGNRIRIIPTMAPRGIMYDCKNNPVVINQPGFSVAILPLSKKIKPQLIENLSVLLNVDKKEIEDKIKKHSGFDPIMLKTDVGPEIWTIIEEQKEKYPGVVIEAQPVRDYIYKGIGAHAFGYVGEINERELEAHKKDKDDIYKLGDIIGKFGLEKIYDQYLRGISGGEQVEVDVTGKPVEILGKKEPVPGKDLHLTIDMPLQLAVEQAIDEQLQKINAHAAAAVVMNPKTGAILAISSRPSFDPNKFAGGISVKDWNEINNNPYHPMDNKTISGEYPPGSVFKIVTGTAALNEHKVTPEEKIYDPGVYWLVPKHNADGEALGLINFTQALAHSDNVYFYEMGHRVGIDTLGRYAKLFGLGQRTGIDLPYEANGLVASKEYKRKVYKQDWYLSETLDAAIGQGFNLVTPLQAAMVMSEIANGGTRYKPYLVDRITNPDGSLYKKFEPIVESKLDGVSPDIITLIQQSLLAVTKIGTAASTFSNFPVQIAGKTGTAENPHGADHGWFVAYGPYNDPQVVVAVIVVNGGYGAQSAVPIGKKILEAAFHITPEPPLIDQQKMNVDKNKTIKTGVQVGH